MTVAADPYPIRPITEAEFDVFEAVTGHAFEHRPGMLARLSAAMSWDPSPWCPGTF